MKKLTKKAMYAKYGIEFDGRYLISPLGPVTELLQDGGNTKLGKSVYTWSTLAGTKTYHVNINGLELDVKGTCKCNCEGCYAQLGRFRTPSVVNALAIRTVLMREHTEWTHNAIKAQIEYELQDNEEGIELRISASGDIENMAIPVWQDVKKSFAEMVTWSYTKNKDAENMFDGFDNANIVKSIIPGHGVNFGHCGYVIDTYKALKAAGKKVYICRCGIDKSQHCERCGVCATYEYVLFVEHSTSYRAEKDPRYNELVELINAQ